MLIGLVRGVEGQWFQKEVFRGAAPVALLQLGQRPLVKLDGVGVRVGPGPHGPRHTEIPLGRERPPAALVLVAQQTTSSPWARFFLKLGTRQIKRSSNYLCSAWHLAELTLPQEQGTWCQLTLPQGTLALLYWLLHRGRLLELWCYYSRDFEWLNVYMFRFAYLHVYVYIYTHWVHMHIQNNASVCNLVFKETNQHRLLFKSNLDSSTSRSWWKREQIALSSKQTHFSSGQQHKDCAFMYITCFQRWKIMLNKKQKLCFINGLAWKHGCKVEYLYRTALSKGWIRHAEHVQRKCAFIEGTSKPLNLHFSKTGEERVNH